MKIIDDLKKYLKTVSPYMVVILALFFWCIYLTECRGPKTVTEYVHTSDTITVVDTVPIIKKEYYPKWYEKIVYQPQPYALPIDSAAIVQEYLSSYMYADTLLNDTSAFIAVYDSISMNNIQARNWKFINRRPTQIITNTTIVNEQPKWNIGVGGVFGGNTERFSFDVGIIVSTKNRAVIQLLYGPMDNTIKLGYFYKLRK